MVPMLWHSAETPNPGTMACSAQTQEGKICRVPYFWRILFHGARNRGLSDLLERWIRKPHHWNKSWNGSYALALGRDTKPGHHALVHPDSWRENLIFCTIRNFIFIFLTGPIAFDSEPRGRRYVKNMIYNRNRLYSRAIHCPASMQKHYVQ